MHNFKRKKWAALILAVLLSASCAHQHQKEESALSRSPDQPQSFRQPQSPDQPQDLNQYQNQDPDRFQSTGQAQGTGQSQNTGQAQSTGQARSTGRSQSLRQSQSPDQSRREEVLSKALQWIMAHPASFEDGGFLEMGEEANLFYVLYTKAQSAEEKQIYRDRLARIVQELRAQKEFHIQYAGEITAYLAITKAAGRLGFETSDFHQFIKREILTSDMTYPMNVTYVILNSALLRDLGYEPKTLMETSIGQGVIASMTKNGYLIPVGKSYASDTDVSNFFYDITHEIFAISSFGDKNPEQMLMPNELEFVRRIIPEGINLYLPKKQLDILCELVVCARIMGYKDMPGLQETLNFIYDSQGKDGDFGLIPRMKDLGRGNLYRHGVLVAVWAMAS